MWYISGASFSQPAEIAAPEGTARIFEALWTLAVWDRNLKFKKEKKRHEKNSGDLSCVMFRVRPVGDGVG
jgi:hypothetical protein